MTKHPHWLNAPKEVHCIRCEFYRPRTKTIGECNHAELILMRLTPRIVTSNHTCPCFKKPLGEREA